ncbi:MAG: hypothetical protein ACKO0W_02150, partial [Planctomycetota bacterium]
FNTASGTVRRIWIDSCQMIGVGRTNPSEWGGGWQNMWVTGGTLTGSKNGLYGDLIRGLQIDVVGSDAFSGAKMVVNCSVRKIDESGTEFHADLMQFYALSTIENTIAYGLEMREPSNTQGLFSGNNISIKDVAFVDVSLDTRVSGVPFFLFAFMFAGPTNHMLVQNCAIFGPAIWRTDLAFSASDVVIRDTTWSNLPIPSPLAGVVVNND